MKKIYAILLIAIIFCCSLTTVNADIIKKFDFDKTLGVSSSELDPDDVIDFPYIFYGNEDEITIDSSITDYTMYYQWIELSDSQVKALDDAKENYENTLEAVKAEAERLFENYEAKYKIYEDLAESGTATEQEITAAKEAADAEYEVYKKYYDTKSAELDELYEAYFKALPDYTSNWTKASKNEVKGDFSYYSDERKFVLYIKLETGSQTIYDYAILTVNGTYEETEDDKKYQSYWEEFVEKFKTVKSMEGLLDLSNNKAYTVTNTDSELKIVYSGEDNTKMTTTFTHEKGIVKLIPNEDENAILMDSLMVTHALTALAEMKGYNLEEFLTWVEAQVDKDVKLATHGIEFISEPYKKTESSEGVSSTIETVKFTKFMMDIANGVKYEKVNSGDANPDAESPKDDTVESPKTGIATYTIAIVGGAVVAGGTYYYLRKKNILKKI